MALDIRELPLNRAGWTDGVRGSVAGWAKISFNVLSAPITVRTVGCTGFTTLMPGDRGEGVPRGEGVVRGEGVARPSGEGVVRATGEGVAQPIGEGVVLARGEGVVLPMEGGLMGLGVRANSACLCTMDTMLAALSVPPDGVLVAGAQAGAVTGCTGVADTLAVRLWIICSQILRDLSKLTVSPAVVVGGAVVLVEPRGRPGSPVVLAGNVCTMVAMTSVCGAVTAVVTTSGLATGLATGPWVRGCVCMRAAVCALIWANVRVPATAGLGPTCPRAAACSRLPAVCALIWARVRVWPPASKRVCPLPSGERCKIRGTCWVPPGEVITSFLTLGGDTTAAVEVGTGCSGGLAGDTGGLGLAFLAATADCTAFSCNRLGATTGLLGILTAAELGWATGLATAAGDSTFTAGVELVFVVAVVARAMVAGGGLGVGEGVDSRRTLASGGAEVVVVVGVVEVVAGEDTEAGLATVTSGFTSTFTSGFTSAFTGSTSIGSSNLIDTTLGSAFNSGVGFGSGSSLAALSTTTVADGWAAADTVCDIVCCFIMVETKVALGLAIVTSGGETGLGKLTAGAGDDVTGTGLLQASGTTLQWKQNRCTIKSLI